jgi:transposase InsO family protein
MHVPPYVSRLYLGTMANFLARKVSGWLMRSQHDTQFATRAPINRGSEFANKLYSKTWVEANVIHSISGTGNRYDNAITESFFTNLRLEPFQGQTLATCAEARKAIFDNMKCSITSGTRT